MDFNDGHHFETPSEVHILRKTSPFQPRVDFAPNTESRKQKTGSKKREWPKIVLQRNKMK